MKNLLFFLSFFISFTVGQSVKIIKSTEGFKVGSETTITAIAGMHINKSGHMIDLDKWKHVVVCKGGWFVCIKNIVKI